MQNKPNFQKARINLTSYGKGTYEKMRDREPQKYKPNQTQFPAKLRFPDGFRIQNIHPATASQEKGLTQPLLHGIMLFNRGKEGFLPPITAISVWGVNVCTL